MRNILIKYIALALTLMCSIPVATATTISYVVLDGGSEGFNDTSAPFANQTGNTGSTLGEQRMNVLQAAADFWEERLVGTSEVTVDVRMDSLECDLLGATLGTAGPVDAFVNFFNAPLPDTVYVVAVVNSILGEVLAGFDADPDASDIDATFNVDIDNNNDCLIGTNWWYGIDSPAPFGTVSLYDTVLHEIAHGLGMVSFTSLSAIDDPDFPIEAGDFFTGDFVPIYDFHLMDETLGLTWGQMTSAQRIVSSTNTGNLVWNGNSANSNSDHLTASSRTNNRIRMFAPDTVQPGSSVSHWDTELMPNELMEPFATGSIDARSTLQLFEDIGWVVQEPDNNVEPESDDDFLLNIIPLIIRSVQDK